MVLFFGPACITQQMLLVIARGWRRFARGIMLTLYRGYMYMYFRCRKIQGAWTLTGFTCFACWMRQRLAVSTGSPCLRRRGKCRWVTS